MLDDLRDLRDAAEGYRAAATAAGITWPHHADTQATRAVPDLVYRLFDVDHVAEQLTWLQSQGWDGDDKQIFPEGGWLQPWPTDAGASLDDLSFAIGTPYPWRHQMPLFYFELVVYTFVLAGDHEGEIWRYEIGPDTWATVRAATSLATLFTEWTKGIAAGVVYYLDLDGWLYVGDKVNDANDPFDVIVERAPDLDPFAFPASMYYQPQIRARQRECGVDMNCIDRGADCLAEHLDDIAAVRRSLGV